MKTTIIVSSILLLVEAGKTAHYKTQDTFICTVMYSSRKYPYMYSPTEGIEISWGVGGFRRPNKF